MADATTSSIVRSILSGNIKLEADEVIKRAKARGVKASEQSIRHLVYNIRSELRAKGSKPAAVPAAARTTTSPKPVAAKVAPTVSAPASSPSGVKSVFANVALVNAVVGVAGGVDQARKVAEAVRACGGVESFLQHLELVAGIKAGGPAA